MGLDVYAGPLTRYFAGDWLTVVQKYGAENGMRVHVVRPRQTLTDLPKPKGLLEQIFTKLRLRSDPPPDSSERADNAQVQELVQQWRDAILLSLREHLDELHPWNESIEAAYDTDKPDWDGLGSLSLWAALSQCPDLTPPSKPIRDWADEPVLARLHETGDRLLYEQLHAGCEVWLPIEMPGTFEGPLPNQRNVCFGSVPALLRELEAINDATWQFTLGASGNEPLDKQLGEVSEFEASACFGFQIMYRLVRFADQHRTPIILDY